MSTDTESRRARALRRRALGVGLASAALGAGLLLQHQRRMERELSGGDPVAVLALTGDLSVGEALSREVLAVRELPEAYVDRRAVRAGDVDQIAGVRVSLALDSGDVLLWSDLAIETEGGRTLARLVPEGMRAVAIRARSFDGLLRPGDRVDVLFTETAPDAASPGRRPPGRTDPPGWRPGGTTHTLLQRLLVLAVGGSTRADSEGGHAHLGSAGFGSVTVSATMDQAKVLMGVDGRGRLDLVLRHPDDIELLDSFSLGLSEGELARPEGATAGSLAEVARAR